MAESTGGAARTPQESAKIFEEAVSYLGMFVCPSAKAVLDARATAAEQADVMKKSLVAMVITMKELRSKFDFKDAAADAERLAARALQTTDLEAMKREAGLFACAVARGIGMPVPQPGTPDASHCPAHGTKCPPELVKEAKRIRTQRT